jgi:hypothetical protein
MFFRLPNAALHQLHNCVTIVLVVRHYVMTVRASSAINFSVIA